MTGILQALFQLLVSLSAPIVCLFYRKGWYLTPDDAVSPYGQGEEAMRKIHARFGTFINDWYWLGIRNRVYGLAYAQKPDHFKRMRNYCVGVKTVNCEETKWLRTLTIDGYTEYMLSCGFFHILAGYRLRPILDEILRTSPQGIPVRMINMDARPILSIRAGAQDD